MSGPFWFLEPPYTLLDFGIFSLFLGAIYTYAGQVYVGTSSWVYRANEPKRYWVNVAAHYVGGIVMVGIFLYEVHAFSN